MFGVTQRRVSEQRPDRGEAKVPGSGGVLAAGFEVVEERADHFRAEIFPIKIARLFAGLLVDVHDQHSQRVPVGRDGFRACHTLLGEPVGEEALQRGRDEAHRVITPGESSSRSAASARSSGAADKYQYVDLGSR